MRQLIIIMLCCLCIAPTVFAASYDGSAPLLCAAISIQECSADSSECHLRMATEVNLPQFIQVDVAQKKIDTIGPEKRSATIQHLQTFDNSIAMQGGQVGRSWSIVIAKETGQMSASVVDDGVGFVIFGACTPRS